MTEKSYQIEIEAWTRTGFRYVVKKTVNDDAAAKAAMDIPYRLGLLPERLEKPDEQKYGRISHVALTHNEETPHVAFFLDNEKMENRWAHKYLNTPEERAEFEAWSGLKLAAMPSMDGNQHPQRGKASQAKFLVALAEPMAVIRLTTYERVTENGQEVWQPSHDIFRYIGKAKAVTVHWAKDAAQMKLVDDWLAEAKKVKPDAYVAALEEIGKRDSFPTRQAYLEALSAIAAKKEAEAQSDDIPF